MIEMIKRFFYRIIKDLSISSRHAESQINSGNAELQLGKTGECEEESRHPEKEDAGLRTFDAGNNATPSITMAEKSAQKNSMIILPPTNRLPANK